MASSSGFARFPEIETGTFSLRQARNAGPTLIFVWRTDCPTCQLTAPFIDRLSQRFRAITVVGFVQDSEEVIRKYAEERGLTMRNFSDASLAVSGQLRVSIVPAYWLLNRQGEVLCEGVGWDSGRMEQITKLLSIETSQAYAPLITPADQVPAFKPG